MQLASDGWTAVPDLDLGALLAPPRCPLEDLCLPRPDRLTAVQRRLVHLGAPIYVRFVPYDTFGRPRYDTIADGAPATVIIANVRPPHPELIPPELLGSAAYADPSGAGFVIDDPDGTIHLSFPSWGPRNIVGMSSHECPWRLVGGDPRAFRSTATP